MTPFLMRFAARPNSSLRNTEQASARTWTGHNRHVLTSSVLGAALCGFIIGATAGQLSDAFLLAAMGALAVASVGALVALVKWLWGLGEKMSTINGTMIAGFLEAHTRHVELDAKVDDGFSHAKSEREALALDLKEISLRVATVEHEFLENDGSSTKDAIARIDRRSRKVAESVGAIDYDDDTEAI